MEAAHDTDPMQLDSDLNETREAFHRLVINLQTPKAIKGKKRYKLKPFPSICGNS